MRKNLFFLLLIIFLIPLECWSQENDIDFTLKQIKENYPGFKDKTNNKAFDRYVSKVLSFGINRDTFWKLSQIVNFFSDHHLQIYKTNFQEDIDSAQCATNFFEINKYFSKSHFFEKYEGLWLNDYSNCIMAIKKISNSPLIYKGYVLESRDNFLLSGLVCCEFEQDKRNTFYTRYISNLGRFEVYLNSIFRNDSVLITGGFGKWKKINDYQYPYLSHISTFNRKVSSKIISDSCFLISIPVCNKTNSDMVDSVVKANKRLIENSKTLIIDIRNNLGGTTKTYYPLLPFIYTNPIKTVDGYLYCSPGFIKNQETDLSLYRQKANPDTNEIAILSKSIDEMKANKGGFLFISGTAIKYDSIKINPKNVALIINYGSASAAELMILAFRQSDKVKIFGETSEGAVDYLDYYSQKTPSKKYLLYIPGTKRGLSVNEPKFDEKGINPDIKIPDTEKDWIKFVKEYYDQ